MLIEILTLAENETFNAILSNATGFQPLNSHDALQRLEVKIPEDLEETLKSIKRNRVILFIKHLFKPYDSIPRKKEMTEEEQARIRNGFVMVGYNRLRWIVKNEIPFILDDTEEMHTELETLRHNSPPLYDKVLAVNLDEFAAKGGGLNTEPLSRMGANNPDKDRDGEQYLYGDLLDWIRDVVGWKDHDLAVRLIGQYAISHCWNGRTPQNVAAEYEEAEAAYKESLVNRIRQTLRGIIPDTAQKVNLSDIFDECDIDGVSIYATPDDVAGEFILKEFMLNTAGRFEANGDERGHYKQSWFSENSFNVSELKDVLDFLEYVAGMIGEGLWSIDEDGRVHLPDEDGDDDDDEDPQDQE